MSVKYQAHPSHTINDDGVMGEVVLIMGIPGSSASKESSCNVGDPSSILGSGSSSGEGRLPIPVFLGFPVYQTVKNLPAMWDTWVHSLGWEDPLKEGVATYSSSLAWR